MSEPLLAVEDLNGWYGTAHVLQGVSFSMGAEPVAPSGVALISTAGTGRFVPGAPVRGFPSMQNSSVRTSSASCCSTWAVNGMAARRPVTTSIDQSLPSSCVTSERPSGVNAEPGM